MGKREGKRKKLSRISTYHYVKLVVHSVLFLTAVPLYILEHVRGFGETFLFRTETYSALLIVLWLLFVGEMVGRFFPSELESMGCQKIFPQNYREIPDGTVPDRSRENHSTLLVALVWIAFNGAFGALYYCRVIDEGALLLLSLAYSLCDMICILFFCPFQTWFLKNKCCGSCRIYNWDYAMIFTPLLFVPSFYTWSLAALALALLIRWETAHARYPERFYEQTNAALRCAHCPEKLCSHKTQLRRFSREQLARLRAAEAEYTFVDKP